MNSIQDFNENTIDRSINIFKKCKYSRGIDGLDNSALFDEEFVKDLKITLLKQYYDQNYKFSKHKTILKGNRNICVYNINDRIILDIITKKIEMVFSPIQESRNDIIKSLICILNQDFEMTVVKIDIKDYYPSIYHKFILSKLKSTNLLPPQLLSIVESFLINFSVDGKGLPQGVSLSSLLAEIYLEQFDKQLRLLHDSILMSCRYVDDIIIVIKGTISEKELKDSIITLLGKLNLSLNDSKYECILINAKSEDIAKRPILEKDIKDKNKTTDLFDYLGYSFKFHYFYDSVNVKKGEEKFREIRDLKIGIAKSKLNNMLYKVNRMFKDFKKNRNYYLLRERIEVFSNNYRIKQEDENELIIGYAEAYKLINNYNALKHINILLDINLQKLNELGLLTTKRYNELKSMIDFKKLFIKQRKKPLILNIKISRLKSKLRTLYRHEFSSNQHLETFIKKNSYRKQYLWSLYYKIVIIKVH